MQLLDFQHFSKIPLFHILYKCLIFNNIIIFHSFWKITLVTVVIYWFSVDLQVSYLRRNFANRNKQTTINKINIMGKYIYTMVFFLPQDKADFITCYKGQRRFKIVADIDKRTIQIQFRSGTSANWMLDLAAMWNADIII